MEYLILRFSMLIYPQHTVVVLVIIYYTDNYQCSTIHVCTKVIIKYNYRADKGLTIILFGLITISTEQKQIINCEFYIKVIMRIITSFGASTETTVEIFHIFLLLALREKNNLVKTIITVLYTYNLYEKKARQYFCI